MTMYYRIVKWFYEKYRKRFEPKIPLEVSTLWERFGVNLEAIRFYGKVLSVQQVDELLEKTFPFPPINPNVTSTLDKEAKDVNQRRIFYKNLLVGIDLRLMQQGYKGEKVKLWKDGRLLKTTWYQSWKVKGGWKQYWRGWKLRKTAKQMVEGLKK